MKSGIYALLFAFVFMGCEQKENVKTYTPRVLTANESFNDFADESKGKLTVFKSADPDSVNKDNKEAKVWYGIKVGDTTVRIQTNMTDKNSGSSAFSTVEFVNTQKTAVIVELANSTGLGSPFYLIALKSGKVEVVNFYRPSTSNNQDNRLVKGIHKVGRSGYLIRNDFFVTTVDARVYFMKRQDPKERIQGIHLINSPDKKTFVFLVSDALYEVHYPTGEVFTQPLSGKAPKVAEYMFKYIQDNYSWQKNAKGISFLKANPDDNRIIDGGDLG